MTQNPAFPEPGRSRLGLSPRLDWIVLVGALGILSAVSPLATDMYLASMPEMGEWFGSPASMIQLTPPRTWWAWRWGNSCWARSRTCWGGTDSWSRGT